MLYKRNCFIVFKEHLWNASLISYSKCNQEDKYTKYIHTVQLFQAFPTTNSESEFVVEVQAIASMIEKQAQIVVKQKEVSEESKKRKEALLAQYANITDNEEYPLFG